MKAISEARTCKDGCKYVRERLQVLVWRMQCTAMTDAVHCRGSCSALRLFPVNVCGEKTRLLWNPFPPCFSAEHKIEVQPKCRLAVSHGAVIKKRKCQP